MLLRRLVSPRRGAVMCAHKELRGCRIATLLAECGQALCLVTGVMHLDAADMTVMHIV